MLGRGFVKFQILTAGLNFVAVPCCGLQRKAWTLEDDEEDDDDDDAKIEADAQEVADLDKSLPLPPAQAAEEEIAQPLDKRRRVAWSEAEAKTTASATSSTVTATTPVSNHAAMNGTAHAADDDIDPLDAFMSSVLAEVDVVPVVRCACFFGICCDAGNANT